MIKIENLKHNYPQGLRLNFPDWEIGDMEQWLLLGASGSGKSTFLRCLNALEEITYGEVSILGHNLFDKNANINKLREDIGMVFQGFNLFPHMTVLENIVMS